MMIEENVNSKQHRNSIIVLAIVAVLVVVSVFVMNEFCDKKLTAEEVFALIAPSTVEINAEGDTFESTGTGCFIDDKGTVVTNYHVVESCHTITIKIRDGNTYNVESVLGFDKERDLAILKAEYSSESYVEIETGAVKTGEKVYALGSSLGLTGTFSEGIVSSESREIDGFDFIQTTAPISSGNSGGPLVNEYGKVIGITTGAFTEGQNLNLAIPAAAINEIDASEEYSMADFFAVSQGKVVEEPNTENQDAPAVDENYKPVDIGFFESCESLEIVAKREPNVFALPVVVSVRGYILRTDSEVYLVYGGVKARHELRNHKGEVWKGDLSVFDYRYQLHMADDTRNRVLTGDEVIIKGVYRHSAKTVSDCVHEIVG